MNDLINNIEKVHTTEMGIERIKRNLSVPIVDEDVVEYCKGLILEKGAVIERKGKNWYVSVCGSLITVNASSYTIITAHKE